MYAQFERHGDSMTCNTCPEQIIPSGLCVGPLLNPDGSPWEASSEFEAQGKSLSCLCKKGHETPVDGLGAFGRIHWQPNPPSVGVPGLFVR